MGGKSNQSSGWLSSLVVTLDEPFNLPVKRGSYLIAIQHVNIRNHPHPLKDVWHICITEGDMLLYPTYLKDGKVVHSIKSYSIKDSSNEYVASFTNKMEYFPFDLRSYNTIKIQILNSNGEIVPASGQVIVRLKAP